MFEWSRYSCQGYAVSITYIVLAAYRNLIVYLFTINDCHGLRCNATVTVFINTEYCVGVCAGIVTDFDGLCSLIIVPSVNTQVIT